MKKLFLLLFLCAMGMTTFAQLPDYSPAPAFTLYEINKADGTMNTTTPIVLYDWTDAGYPVFIDVFATWCGPCKMLAPIIEKLAGKHEEVVFLKVNVDEVGELAAKFNVQAIPTLAFIENGKLVHTELGFKPESEIEKLL